ncbi:MAG: endonuclease, partial [Cryobacterium sp.]
MRLVIAKCSVDYAGRLSAHLPLATRLLMLKSDGSVLVHSDGGSYKPLNWMSPPCSLAESEPDADQTDAGITALWTVTHGKSADQLTVSIFEVLHDSAHELGIDPGLIKEG